MNHWETPELTPDVDFFLLSRYKCTTETMRILSLVCGNSTRRGLHGTTTRFRKLPWTYSVIHYLFGAKHERVFKHMNDRFWESDSFLKHKVQQCWSFQFLLVLHFFFFFFVCLDAISCKQYYGTVNIMESSFPTHIPDLCFLIYLMMSLKV